jgi:hypothetical protein
MEAKNDYNTPENKIFTSSLYYYEYRDKFAREASIILSKPILNALQARKQSLASFAKELNQNGYKYSYTSLANAVRGNNKYVKNFNYFALLYYYLNLPFPSLQYLSSFD